MPIRPFLYAENFHHNGSISKLIENGTIAQPDYVSNFTYHSSIKNDFNYKFIFKNGGINASIFEDGLNNWLESPLIAETWGRPLQESWCGFYDVVNIQNIKLS